MFGIVGGVSNQDITHLLLDGLKRLEYRGYDSLGWRYINECLLEEDQINKIAMSLNT